MTPDTRAPGLRPALAAALRRPATVLSLAWLLLVVVTSALAPLIDGQDPLGQDLAHTLAGPSTTHWLGTDELGRDILSRLLHGGGYLMLIALVPVSVSFALGVPGGLLAGYAGGWLDALTGFTVAVTMALPGIVVTLAVAAASGNNLVVMCLVIGVLGSGGIVRLTRATTQATRNLLYVDAARIGGLPRRRILARHILPNVAGPLIVQGFVLYGGAFMFLTALSFLSLGFSPESPSWGQLTYDASQHLSDDPWMMLPIGVALVLTVLTLNTLGSAVLTALPTARRGNQLVAAALATPRVATAAQPTPPDAVLSVANLSVAFPGEYGGRPVVEDVTLHLRRGRCLGLVGESGSGKSLTALSLIGLLPPAARVVSGHVRSGGRDLLRMPEKQLTTVRGSRIGYVSQEPMVALDPCFTVRNQVTQAVRTHHRCGRRVATARCRELLRLVGVAEPDRVAASHPHHLSGGTAQRVAIALALAGAPEVLIADEPTTALDVTVQAEILDLLRALRLRLGTAVLLVTHDLGVVADSCDDVAVMYAGQIVETGTADEVLRQPTHPYTVALLQATPERYPHGTDVPTVPGTVPAPPQWPDSCRFAARCALAAPACLAAPVALEMGPRQHSSRCVRSGDVSAGALR